MIEQLQTIRAALEDLCSPFSHPDNYVAADKALTALSELERTVGEPVAWCELTQSGEIAYFDGKPMVMIGPVGNEHHRLPLYTAPPAQQPQYEAADMASAAAQGFRDGVASVAQQQQALADALYALQVRADLRAENQRLREALNRIKAIEDKLYGGDWDEIGEARLIAGEALRNTK